jgi:hypothetical protein
MTLGNMRADGMRSLDVSCSEFALFGTVVVIVGTPAAPPSQK